MHGFVQTKTAVEQSVRREGFYTSHKHFSRSSFFCSRAESAPAHTQVTPTIEPLFQNIALYIQRETHLKMKTHDNVIFITGGSTGIGLSIAKTFLHSQNTVIVCGRDEKKLARARQAHPDLHTLQCDVTDDGDNKRAFQKITSEHKGLNILINNAGIQYNYNLYDADVSPEKIQQEIDTNFSSLVKLTTMFLPTLMKQPEAAIVNVSSATGIVPKQNGAVYSATKAAVHSFSSVLRRQLAKSSVKVFELFPPVVDTEMTKGRGGDKVSPESVASQLIRSMKDDQYEIPVGRVRWLFLIHRISPALAAKIIQKQA